MILGIDPGETTGWALYDRKMRRAVGSGEFERYTLSNEVIDRYLEGVFEAVVIERPVAHGPTRPQVVECAYVTGRLFQTFLKWHSAASQLTRLQVRQRLQLATHGVVQVKNDATVWAALKILHGGDDSAKRGGALHGVKAHGRAALAVAVAWTLPAAPNEKAAEP